VAPKCELFLARDWDAAWREAVRPWLAGPREATGLRRDYVLVPTRGQAHALKLRCVREGVPLLGVEFLSPGLARKKWAALQADPAPALGRELLLFGLRAIIDARLRAARPRSETGGAALRRDGKAGNGHRGVNPLLQEDATAREQARSPTVDDAADDALPPEWGVLMSLRSDPERALDDFDTLLKGGFGAEDFPDPVVRAVFVELAGWARGHGYELAPPQAERAALTPRPPDAPRAGDRVFLYGFSAEAWSEFFNLAAFVRCCGEVRAVLPAPEFGPRQSDENWVKIWETFLDVEPVLLADDSADNRSAACADLWLDRAASAAPPSARLLVSQSRTDESQVLAGVVGELLAAGAENIAVVFPPASTNHRRLARLLTERGVAFADLLGAVGTPPVESRIQRALLDFFDAGGRLEELLALWALLRPLNLVPVPLGGARAVCERLFDDGQTHQVAAYAARLGADESEGFRAVAALAQKLAPWPVELTLADALARFAQLGEVFTLGTPANWPALQRFATSETRAFPVRLVVALLRSFLPEKAPAASAPDTVFARVTLTTRRRAEALAWSHVIFAEANAEVWPVRPEPSPWLPDEAARRLNERGRFSLGVFPADERTALERAGDASLARNARAGVVFTAALHDEEDPEAKLSPNRWVERVLFAEAGDRKADVDWTFEREWSRRAGPVPPVSCPPSPASEGLARWHEVWQGRRDPARPFDEYCYSVAPEAVQPARLPARLIERAVSDPVELWFDAVLGVKQVAWEPLARARKKAVGQIVHALLAAALRGPPVEGAFGRVPAAAECREKLAAALAGWRARRPHDRYWDSFHAELTHTAQALLEKVLARAAGRFAVVEFPLPREVRIPVSTVGAALRRDESRDKPAPPVEDGARDDPAAVATLRVTGRIDLALAEVPRWDGGFVEVIDFKTGADEPLSVGRMAERGASLQLGLYLAAVRALGAPDGRVWLLKPEAGGESALAMSELDAALAPLARIWRHLTTGHYGALTPDRDEFTILRPMPLACTPVPERVLRAKFAVTFEDNAASPELGPPREGGGA